MPVNVIFDKSQIASHVNADRDEHDARKKGGSDYLEWALGVLIFIVSLLYLFLFRRHSGMDPDEGIVLQGADRVLRGEVPYRDFFSFYTPGSFYLVAALFKLFGNSFLVARTSIAVVGAGCSVITYLLALRVCSNRKSVV